MTFLDLFIFLNYKKLHIIFIGDKMKNFKKYITIYLYAFIIFTSMLPTKENMINLKELKTIIPGIQTLYNEETNVKNKEQNNEYSFKILEILKNTFKL